MAPGQPPDPPPVIEDVRLFWFAGRPCSRSGSLVVEPGAIRFLPGKADADAGPAASPGDEGPLEWKIATLGHGPPARGILWVNEAPASVFVRLGRVDDPDRLVMSPGSGTRLLEALSSHDVPPEVSRLSEAVFELRFLHRAAPVLLIPAMVQAVGGALDAHGVLLAALAILALVDGGRVRTFGLLAGALLAGSIGAFRTQGAGLWWAGEFWLAVFLFNRWWRLRGVNRDPASRTWMRTRTGPPPAPVEGPGSGPTVKRES